MSNHLAIATVTAALKKMLQEGISQDIPGAQVTTVRPDAASSSVSGACINLFMYHAMPNAAWRNADLRTRRPKGELVKHGQASLDLYYLLTFYGNEQRLEPQRLMGSAVQTLVDRPQLTQPIIQETVDSTADLIDSTLGEQMQLVRFFPAEITTEELSRIWSVFFQIPYALSFAYQGTAVIIQGRKPGRSALPVRSRRFYATPQRPVIEKITTSGELNEPITLDSHITLHGRGLKGRSVGAPRPERDLTQVSLGKARITPQVVTENKVEITLPTLSAQEISALRAGAQGLRIAQTPDPPLRDADYAILSNLMSVVLCPTIHNGSEGISVRDVTELEENACTATLTVSVDMTIEPRQNTFLMLNKRDHTSKTYIIRGERQTAETTTLTFQLNNVLTGTYLVRVQVDGAESPLEVDTDENSDTFEQYIGPTIWIGGEP
ncbi:DUF4255 domain-containing protein [Oscillatoria sp. CS-180]|uniref:DUF4255 domain-containing protein n=1 Tax=Oscillatoria sp. CS-180 TaxID=3021720 RepID=UPI00232FAA8E|nr:DUF4255 domain-containing protein [Oscillatoria sp. CS-180]MDB9526531.1 DUF4255 domain-containing protein [Oscillatoria sp. CS-180]